MGFSNPPNLSVAILNHSTSESEFIGRQGHYRANKIKMRLLKQVLIQYNWCPQKTGKVESRHAHGENDTGRLGYIPQTEGLLQAKRKAGKRPSHRALGMNQPCNTLISGF